MQLNLQFRLVFSTTHQLQILKTCIFVANDLLFDFLSCQKTIGWKRSRDYDDEIFKAELGRGLWGRSG